MNSLSSSVKELLHSVTTSVSSAERDEGCDENRPVEWNLPGFMGGVRVSTSFGDLPIEALRIRDEIRTASGVFARVQWIDKLHLDADFMRKHPSAQPIIIPADSFGIGRPMKDITVSPRQQVCADAHVAAHFQSAADLCRMSRAYRLQTLGLTYYRFHCGGPAAVRVEGVWVRV